MKKKFVSNSQPCKNCVYNIIFLIKYLYNLFFKLHYRSELWDQLFFDDCLNYLNFNSMSNGICTINNVKAVKIILKISLE